MSSSEDESGYRPESPVLSTTGKKKHIRTKTKAEDFVNYGDKKQAYEIPDMWIGNTVKSKFKTYILPLNTEIPEGEARKVKEKTLTLPEGVWRIFLEIVSNASDNVIRSLQQGVEPGQIEVTCDEKTVSVKNYGVPIPVEKRSVKQVGKEEFHLVPYDGTGDPIYPPEFIFGRFRTSSNYDKTVVRYGCGRNGVGAKVTNLFSKRFKIIVDDLENGLRFIGIWKDNFFMNDENGHPEISVKELPVSVKKSSVTVEWDLDFKRFGMTGYSKDEISYFARAMADFSFATKVPFVFNGVKLDYRSIRDYATLYFTKDELENSIVQYTWGYKKPEKGKKNGARNEIGTKKIEKSIISPKSQDDIPDLEIMIIDTPDTGRVISYVNGLVSKNGGAHVDAVLKPIFKHFTSTVNGDKKKGGITATNVSPHISAIVNARLPDPRYDSQSKTKLEYPKVHLEIIPKLLKLTNNWDTLARLYAELQAKGIKGASASDGKKEKNAPFPKGRDANLSGTEESMKCTLILTEGDSATGLPQWMVALTENGEDYMGYMPLRGKILNITKAGQLQYNESKVISSIKNAMGFQEGVDYSLEENIQKLRYGNMIIAGDADSDGYHIVSLVLNLVREKFPGMLKQNRIGYLRTPIVKVYKGNKIHKRFLSEVKFYKWLENHPDANKKYKIEYYKGLGSFSEEDVKEDLDYSPTVICFYDKEANQNFDLAFDDGRADDRKDWIERWRDIAQTDDVLGIDLEEIKGKDGLYLGQNISQFINRELIGYSVASLFRAIPSEYDGLKESQRKALYGVLKKFNYSYSPKNKALKVEVISNEIAAAVEYHHGSKNLADTIIKMTQDFTGANNMGYFSKKGMFGSRECGGQYSAAARYSKIQLNWWVPLVFYKESIELVKKRDVDGNTAEPYWLPAVIPMGLTNKMEGIATGFSTFLPGHDPLVLIDIIEKMLAGEKPPDDIMPWFNGFEGKLSLETKDVGDSSRKKKTIAKEEDEEEVEEGEEEEDRNEEKRRRNAEKQEENIIEQSVKKSRKVVKTIGVFKSLGVKKNGQRIIKITELPVRAWTGKYVAWINSVINEKGKNKLIGDVKNKSKPNTVDIEIVWKSKETEPTIHNLHLVKSFGLSNITLIDHDGFPRKYKNATKVLKTYFKHMITHYGELKDHRVKVEEDKIQMASYKTRYIQGRLDGEIHVKNMDEEQIKTQLEKINVPFEIYDKMKERDLSKQSLAKWKQERRDAEVRLEEIRKQTPESIWLEKLAKLKKALMKRYKDGRLDMTE